MTHHLHSADKHVPGWKKLSSAQSAGHANVDLDYHAIEPQGGRQHGNGRAVFYLHGLIGHPQKKGGAWFLPPAIPKHNLCLDDVGGFDSACWKYLIE